MFAGILRDKHIDKSWSAHLRPRTKGGGGGLEGIVQSPVAPLKCTTMFACVWDLHSKVLTNILRPSLTSVGGKLGYILLQF